MSITSGHEIFQNSGYNIKTML